MTGTLEEKITKILRAHTTQDGDVCTELTITPQAIKEGGQFNPERGWWIRVGNTERPFTAVYECQTISEGMELAVHGDRIEEIRAIAARTVAYDQIDTFVRGYLACDKERNND